MQEYEITQMGAVKTWGTNFNSQASISNGLKQNIRNGTEDLTNYLGLDLTILSLDIKWG